MKMEYVYINGKVDSTLSDAISQSVLKLPKSELKLF